MGNFFWGKLYKTGYRECFNLVTFPFSTFQDVISKRTSKLKFPIKFEKFWTIIFSKNFCPFLVFSLYIHWCTKRYPMFVYNTSPSKRFFFSPLFFRLVITIHLWWTASFFCQVLPDVEPLLVKFLFQLLSFWFEMYFLFFYKSISFNNLYLVMDFSYISL